MAGVGVVGIGIGVGRVDEVVGERIRRSQRAPTLCPGVGLGHGRQRVQQG
jgi:hypothetical protein